MPGSARLCSEPAREKLQLKREMHFWLHSAPASILKYPDPSEAAYHSAD